jgi:hypothetical protein
MGQSVPKRRHIKFRRRGIIQKKENNKVLQFCEGVQECMWRFARHDTLSLTSFTRSQSQKHKTCTRHRADWSLWLVFLIYSQTQPTRCNVIQCSLWLLVLYMFRAGFPLIIRSSKNYTCSIGICQTCVLLSLIRLSRNRCCMYSFWAPDDERKKTARNM